MRLATRGRLFLVSVVLFAVSVAAAELYLLPAVEQDLTTRIREDLHVRLQLVAERAAAHAPATDGARTWDALADRLGALAQARVTFVAADGSVLGDSEVAVQDLPGLENHRVRPEIAAAFAGQTSDSIRYSATTHRRMLYAATPVAGAVPIVARVSLPLAWVDGAKNRLRAVLLGGAAVALLVAVLLASVAAVVMSAGLRNVTAVARRMAAGDLDARCRPTSSDEVGQLGRTLDDLAAKLSRSLRELRDDRDLLGRILESMREGVLVTDGERRILLANPSLREMLLLDADVVGRAPIEVIRNAELQAIVDRTLAGHEPVVGEIAVGGIKPLTLRVHAAKLSGEPRALLLVLFDVTEMRRLETVRRDFVSNVSHELRTPIASVRSAAESLRTAMERDPEMAKSFVDIVERNGRRLGELVNDLLDLSKIEAKEYRLDVEPLDLTAVATQTVATLAERAKARGMELSTEIPKGCARVLGDRHALDRVLVNLIDNAIKYCPEKARIAVTARELGAKVELAVSDNGPGIDEDHLPRLFERFYRVDPGRSRDMGGTGLGLSIVKHLVEAMGGEVGVESTPGRGSTFRFTVPRAG